MLDNLPFKVSKDNIQNLRRGFSVFMDLSKILVFTPVTGKKTAGNATSHY